MKAKFPLITCLSFLLIIGTMSVFANGKQESSSSSSTPKQIVLAVFTGPEETNMEITKNLFEKQTGISIQVDQIARNAYQAKFTTELMSGAHSWDVLYLQGAFFQAMAKAGTLHSLNGVLSQKTQSELIPVAFKKGFYNGTLEALVANWHTNFYYYRKDLLANDGLPVAKDWQQFLTNAQKLTTKGTNGQQMYGDVYRAGTANNSIHYNFSNYLLAFGAKWLDSNFKPVMNSPQGIAALQYYVDLKNKYHVVPPDVASVGYPEMNQYFQSGRVGQVIQWSAAYPVLFSSKDSPQTYDKTGVTIVPGRMQSDGSLVHGSLATNDMWVVPKGTQDFAGAEAFIRWMASPAGAKEWALNGDDPINSTIYNDPAVLKARPLYKVAAVGNKYAGTFPALPQGPQLLSVWTDNLARAVAGDITAKQAMDTIAAKWTTILKNAGYYK